CFSESLSSDTAGPRSLRSLSLCDSEKHGIQLIEYAVGVEVAAVAQDDRGHALCRVNAHLRARATTTAGLVEVRKRATLHLADVPAERHVDGLTIAGGLAGVEQRLCLRPKQHRTFGQLVLQEPADRACGSD